MPGMPSFLFSLSEIKSFRLFIGEALLSFYRLSLDKTDMMKIAQLLLLGWLLAFGNSCVSYDTLLNYREDPDISKVPPDIENFSPIVIQANDILDIRISGSDPLAAAPFYLIPNREAAGANNLQNLLLNGYLVDLAGQITLPTIGKVTVSGLTTQEASEKILNALQPNFEDPPIVNTRLLNFKINVSGEVVNPGTFNINGERVTVVEALIMAGDFNEYSKRDSVLIIREENNKRSFGYVNFNSASVFTSPYFYLKQNDVVYVLPEKTKLGSIRNPATNVLPWISAVTSLTALIISILR